MPVILQATNMSHERYVYANLQLATLRKLATIMWLFMSLWVSVCLSVCLWVSLSAFYRSHFYPRNFKLCTTTYGHGSNSLFLNMISHDLWPQEFILELHFKIKIIVWYWPLMEMNHKNVIISQNIKNMDIIFNTDWQLSTVHRLSSLLLVLVI